MLLKEEESDGGKKIQNWRAEDIVDFAWTAWPGYAVYTDQWEHVKFTLLLPKERIVQVSRQFKAVKQALEYLTKNVGPYPWPYVTFIDPPAKGGNSGGMEYTTLFTSQSFYGVPEFTPSSSHGSSNSLLARIPIKYACPNSCMVTISGRCRNSGTP